MYQLEVKRWLVEHRYNPANGWAVTVDIDPMERDVAGTHKPGKREAAAGCEGWLREHGAQVVAHELFGRADLVAARAGEPTVIVEVEGDSSRQREQALYSALGQLLVSMQREGDFSYALAVPDDPTWVLQVKKIPLRIQKVLRLELLLVSERGVREWRDI